MKTVWIIAGPNGAGKTTFAREFLPREVGVKTFINADLIAAGLAPFAAEKQAVRAGRLMLEMLDQAAAGEEDFAFETTLSGLTYVSRLQKWRAAGWSIMIIYLRLAEVELALERVAERVRKGGHDIPEADVRRRFVRSWSNFRLTYAQLADGTIVLNNEDVAPIVEQLGGNER